LEEPGGSGGRAVVAEDDVGEQFEAGVVEDDEEGCEAAEAVEVGCGVGRFCRGGVSGGFVEVDETGEETEGEGNG
jgi:hypothetical protein